MIELPLRHPELFERLGVEAPKGVLLHGPPGTGKTVLAKAVADESQANFISVKGPRASEQVCRRIREGCQRSLPKGPPGSTMCHILRRDRLNCSRSGKQIGDSHVTGRVISQFLTELDGLEQLRNGVIIAATNRPDIVDRALLRGRFDRLLYIAPPDLEARRQIFTIRTRKTPLAEDANLDELGWQTDGYTGADIRSVCNTAFMLALRELIGKAKNPEDAKKWRKTSKCREGSLARP